MKSHYYISFVAWCLIQNRWSNKLAPPRQETRKRFRSSNLKARSYLLHHDQPVSKSSLERAIAIDHSVCSYENCQRLRSQCQSNLRMVLTHVVNIQSCIFGPQSAQKFYKPIFTFGGIVFGFVSEDVSGTNCSTAVSNTKNWCVFKGSEWHKGSWYPAIVILLRMKS